MYEITSSFLFPCPLPDVNNLIDKLPYEFIPFTCLVCLYFTSLNPKWIDFHWTVIIWFLEVALDMQNRNSKNQCFKSSVEWSSSQVIRRNVLS